MKNVPFVLATVAATAGPALAAAPAPETGTDRQVEALTSLVADLRDEVASLRASQQGDAWLTDRRAEEIRGLVEDVLADVDTRASLLQSGVTAGHDGHFFMASSDGNFRLELDGQIQVRYVYNNRSNSGMDDNVAGFESRRTKVGFSGNIMDPTVEYGVVGAFDRAGGLFELEDAYIQKSYDNGMTIKVGQFKAPFLREELVSSKRQLAADRSLVNETFNQDRSQGIQFGWKQDQFQAMVMVHDGFSNGVAASGGVNAPWQTTDTEFAVTARAEMLLSGNWKQFRDFTSPQGSEQALMVGAAVHWEKAEYGTAAGPEEEDMRFTVDVSLEMDGANVYAAFVYQDMDIATANPWGFVVQGGLYLSEDWEAFVRYEFGDADSASIEDLSVITVGVNKYWAKHSLKWTTDVGFGLEEMEGFWDSSGVGYLPDATNEDGQVVLRTQLQLLF